MHLSVPDIEWQKPVIGGISVGHCYLMLVGGGRQANKKQLNDQNKNLPFRYDVIKLYFNFLKYLSNHDVF